MAESSFLWDADGGGDESPHSEADVTAMFNAFMGGSGVIFGILNSLAPSVNGSDIRIASGWAMVDGHPYRNSATLDTAVVQPSVGTTGRRMVLQCTWGATQTVRIAEISSADGTATIPALTQTPGTLYEISLCSYTVTTLSVVGSFADTRTFCNLKSPAFDEMLALGGGALAAPTGLSAYGRIGVIGFHSRMSSPIYDTNAYNTILDGGVQAWCSTVTINPIASMANGITTLNTGAGGAGSSFGIGPQTIPAGTAAVNIFVAPDRSPWMRFKFNPTAAGHANITQIAVGFMQGISGTTQEGVYIRRSTTGNLFFVTRQSGAETATDMGTQSNAQRWYDIWTPDAGVTWHCYDHTAGTLYTHTTNVPTATVDLNPHGRIIISGAVAGQFAMSALYVCALDE